MIESINKLVGFNRTGKDEVLPDYVRSALKDIGITSENIESASSIYGGEEDKFVVVLVDRLQLSQEQLGKLKGNMFFGEYDKGLDDGFKDNWSIVFDLSIDDG